MKDVKFVSFLYDLIDYMDDERTSRRQVKITIKRFILKYLKKEIEDIPKWSLTEPNY